MSPSGTSTFPQFTRLPPELRHQIWTQSLPECISPAIFIYKKECWQRSEMPDSSKSDFIPEEKTAPRFHHTLLDDIPLEIPLLLACHESQSVTLAWAKQQEGIRLKYVENKLSINHAFLPSRDVLYMSPAAVRALEKDQNDGSRTAYNGNQALLAPSSVKKIMIHCQIAADICHFCESGFMLAEWLSAVESVLLIVINMEGDPLQFRTLECTPQERWEYEVFVPKEDEHVLIRPGLPIDYALDIAKRKLWDNFPREHIAKLNIKPVRIWKRQ